ncbi:hypothetical protein ACLMJK_000700 [Lecanora helva]
MAPNAGKLSYEAKEPSFLRKLRAQRQGDDLDRHEKPLARPRKQMQNNEEDDQPIYVDEDGLRTLSKSEYDHLAGRQEEQKSLQDELPSSINESKGANDIPGTEDVEDTTASEISSRTQQAAAIGAPKKRRLAKVVGEGVEEAGGAKIGNSRQQQENHKSQKVKKVKLSFDEESMEGQ